MPVLRQNSVRSQVVDQSALIRRESRPMITLLLHLLRLLPFLCGGHRQLALENLALRQQLAVYKRTTNRAATSTERSPPVGLAVQGVARLEAGPRHRRSIDRAELAAPPLSPPLGHALRTPFGGPPAHRRRDQHSGQKYGRDQSPAGGSQNPRR